MPDNFTSENVDSAGQVFATDQDSVSLAHYPIGKIAWGALNAFNITDTANPLPVQLFGNAVNSSFNPMFVRGSDSVNGLLVNLGGNNDITGTVTVNALTSASRVQVEPVTSSMNRTFVDNNSEHPVFVRSIGGSATFVVATASSAPVHVRGLSDSTVPISGAITATLSGGQSSVSIANSSTAHIGTVTNPASDSLGLSPFTGAVSSVATTVKATVGRLYGWYISNPSSNTAGAYLKVYAEDSGGVTLGTNSAVLDFWIPPEGAANMSIPAGISMSSGISLAAAGGAGSTNHDAPPASLTVSLWYA